MSVTRDKFNSQVRPEILNAVREIASSEGRQFQSVVEEAFVDLIEKHRGSQPRAHVMAAYRASAKRFAPLLKKLAE